MSDLRDDPYPKADSLNLCVIEAGPHDVFLDLDTQEAFDGMWPRLRLLRERGLKIMLWHIRPSKSGLPKRHVYLKVPHVLNEYERIALQAVLGSDPVRETLAMARVGSEWPSSVFFEPHGFSLENPVGGEPMIDLAVPAFEPDCYEEPVELL